MVWTSGLSDDGLGGSEFVTSGGDDEGFGGGSCLFRLHGPFEFTISITDATIGMGGLTGAVDGAVGGNSTLALAVGAACAKEAVGAACAYVAVAWQLEPLESVAAGPSGAAGPAAMAEQAAGAACAADVQGDCSWPCAHILVVKTTNFLRPLHIGQTVVFVAWINVGEGGRLMGRTSCNIGMPTQPQTPGPKP